MERGFGCVEYSCCKMVFPVQFEEGWVVEWVSGFNKIKDLSEKGLTIVRAKLWLHAGQYKG